MIGAWRCVLVVGGLWAAAMDRMWAVEGGVRTTESNLVQPNAQDNIINLYTEDKEEAVKGTVKEPYVPGSRSPVEIVIGAFNRLLKSLHREQCLEHILCEVGASLSHIEMVRLGSGMMMAQVPSHYATYARAFLTGVMKTQCDYHCVILAPRDEL